MYADSGFVPRNIQILQYKIQLLKFLWLNLDAQSSRLKSVKDCGLV